jgi:phenylalanyl-tRNA synthetase alpha subunit
MNTITTTDRVDLEWSKLQSTKDVFIQLSEEALQIKVTDDVSLAIANQKLSAVNNHLKLIEEKRTELKKPYLDAGKKVDAVAKDLSEPLNNSIQYLKNQIKEWNLELLRREQELKQQAPVNSLFEDNINHELAMLESQKASNVRHNWKFDVVDLSRVPVQFLMVDEAKVREWIKANKESLNDGDIIAGIKFYKEVSIVTK